MFERVECCSYLKYLFIFSNQPPSPSSSITGILNDETVDLIERLADVQQEKWLLEERVRHLWYRRALWWGGARWGVRLIVFVYLCYG